MPVTAAGAIAVAVTLDYCFEEFPGRVHPVAWYGRVLEPFDRPWGHPRFVGALVAGGFPLLAGGLAALVTDLAGRSGPFALTVVAGIVVFSTTSLRMLVRVASEVIEASEGSLPAARDGLSALVGREAASLSPGQVRSAAVESVAENLADGYIAPLFAFAVVAPWSLPAAAGVAVWVKAVNTADSMLGYREKPVGEPAARLDDLVMWAPARLTALLIALAARDIGALRRARSWAATPASPNSGWPMAAVATVLGVRLEKPGAYTINPGGSLPTTEQAAAGIRVAVAAGVLGTIVAGVIAWS